MISAARASAHAATTAADQSPAKSSFQSDWIAFFFSYAHW